LLVLLAIGIAVTALVLGLAVREGVISAQTASLEVHQRMLSIAVIEGARVAQNETLLANCTLESAVDSAACVCKMLGCSAATQECALAPTAQLKLACSPCSTPGLPCHLA
jgi:hypothetical protein